MKRLQFIDVARALAIALAMLAHGMITFGGWDQLGEGAPYVQLFTRTATPLFIFMFGMMLEIVYVRRMSRSGLQPVSRRLLVRSMQCYVGFIATAAAGWIGGNLSGAEFLSTFIFLEDAQFGNILRFYSVALLLAIPLLWARKRLGAWVLVATIAGIWAGDLLLQPYKGVSFGFYDHWISIGLGTGAIWGGPSVWHGTTFMLAGMLLASALTEWRERGLKKFYKTAALFSLAPLSVIGWLVAESSLTHVAGNFASVGVYRAANHIGYYAIGTFACIVILVALAHLIPLKRKLPDWTHSFLVLGYSSLLSYTLGNIILNLVPSFVPQALGNLRVAAAALFVGVLPFLVIGWSFLYDRTNEILRSLADTVPSLSQEKSPV